ncbi:MAG: type II toxin-antitoxin system CcdA family antitoxin [Geobacter sp.]|jgi:antitoxin CcdA
MQLAYDHNAPRKTVNLTVNSELLRMMRQEKCNLSAFVDNAMEEHLKQKELQCWKEENRAAFDSYNRMIAEHGPISEELGLL